jgi:hypothetical protein
MTVEAVYSLSLGSGQGGGMHGRLPAIVLAGVALVACTDKSSQTATMSPPAIASGGGNPSSVYATRTSGQEISCARSDLHARFAGGGNGGQTHFALFVIWNVSDKPCRLSGKPSFAAALPNDHTGRRASVHQPNARVDTVLPRRTPAYRDGHLTPAHYLWASIAAPQFTQNGSCADAHSKLRLVTPATFTVHIAAITMTVKNRDPTATKNSELSSCEGEFTLGRLRISG